MNANYKALLSPENYEDLRQAAIDLKIREMMNVGCAWHIVWTGWQIRHSRLIRAILTTLRCLSNRQHGM